MSYERSLPNATHHKTVASGIRRIQKPLRLHLDEHHDAAPLHDQVDLALRAPPVAVEHDKPIWSLLREDGTRVDGLTNDEAQTLRRQAPKPGDRIIKAPSQAPNRPPGMDNSRL